VQVQLVSSGDLKAVAKALRKHADGKELRRELTQGIREVLAPAVPAVKAAWLSAPSKGRRHPGRPSLRSLLARSTRMEVRTTGRFAGARVRTDGRKMPDQMRSLPSYAEGIRGRPWRHPVMGDRETWVTQEPFPRFYDAANEAVDQADAVREIERVVGRIFDKIERAR
jgi:hypothetical protein